MSFNIEVLKVSIENKGKYRVAVVDHKTADGKVDSKKIMSFVNKDVFTTLSTAQQGDQFEVVSEKDTNGYWQWVTVSSMGKAGNGSNSKVVPSTVRSSYETPDERAARQVYIVRQSTISSAIALRPKATVDEILEVARQFEAYVFAKDEIQPAEVS